VIPEVMPLLLESGLIGRRIKFWPTEEYKVVIQLVIQMTLVNLLYQVI
jgi:hypothetical protein